MGSIIAVLTFCLMISALWDDIYYLGNVSEYSNRHETEYPMVEAYWANLR